MLCLQNRVILKRRQKLEAISLIGSLASIGGAVFALMAWAKAGRIQEELALEKKRLNKSITVTLQYGSKQIKLPMDFRRADLTRAEVLGRLGMIPMKDIGKRFSISYLSSPEFLKQIDMIVEGDGESLLTIPCNETEFHQFDLETT